MKAHEGFLNNGTIVLVKLQIDLLQFYTVKDVKATILAVTGVQGQMNMRVDFFRAIWANAGNDIAELILEFFSNGKLLT